MRGLCHRCAARLIRTLRAWLPCKALKHIQLSATTGAQKKAWKQKYDAFTEPNNNNKVSFGNAFRGERGRDHIFAAIIKS